MNGGLLVSLQVSKGAGAAKSILRNDGGVWLRWHFADQIRATPGWLPAEFDQSGNA